MKYLKWFIDLLPVLALIGTGLLWIDSRYMYRNISDARHVEIQLQMYERELKRYERRVDNNGYIPSSEETREYDVLKQQVMLLTKQRNKIIGLEIE